MTTLSFPRALLCLTFGITVALPASGAELRVLCPNALRAPVLELARTFVRSSMHRVEFIFASVGAIHKRVATGESVDIVIGTAQGVDALVRLGRAVEGSDATIAHTALALATHRNATAPGVATGEALARTLRDAASLVQPDAGRGVPGGGQASELMQRLGLAAELKEKTYFVSDAREVVKRVAAGVSEIGIAAMSDIVGTQDVVATGPLIDPPTVGVSYAVALVRRTAFAETGSAFIGHLLSTEAKSVFRAAGYAVPD